MTRAKPKKPDPRMWDAYANCYGSLVGVRDGKPEYAAKLALKYARRGLSEFKRLTGERK